MRALLMVVVLVLLAPMPGVAPAAASTADPFDALVQRDLTVASLRLGTTAKALAATDYPFVTGPDGDWTTTDAAGWTSGFFPGALWRLYEATGRPGWRVRAEASQADIAGQQFVTTTHDIGFEVFTSFGNATRLTGSDADRQVVLQAAASLATRYSSTVKAIRSWDGPPGDHFRVIIDNMMNLELLLWASKHGGSSAWYDMALQHALTTSASHVRADGSTYQGVDFDPTTGSIRSHFTHQGVAVGSTWARGQAWAIHGFTMVYRETGDARFLATARRVADWYLDHLPADHVPYWDFAAPDIPDASRDSSAAAIAAAGLLELGRLETDPTHAERDRRAAKATLTALSRPPYLAPRSRNAAILQHGTHNGPAGSFDTGLIYGDYYLIEALLRYRALTGVVTDVGTGHPIVGATIVVDGRSTLSRVDGRYRLIGIGSGIHPVTVSAPGYQPMTGTATLPRFGVAALDAALSP